MRPGNEDIDDEQAEEENKIINEVCVSALCPVRSRLIERVEQEYKIWWAHTNSNVKRQILKIIYE